MLFFLTGNIQIGKTRWLLRQIDALESAGVECCGVAAPGRWIKRGDGYEKTGIDNLLLPDRRIVPFAQRRDLALANGTFDENSQAAGAKLGWAIDDTAISQVNKHFEQLSQIDDPGARLLVVDEMGSLELERGEGLTKAVELVNRGSTPMFPHALIVVRAQLLETARARFAKASWNGMEPLFPTEDGAARLAQETKWNKQGAPTP